MREGRALGPDDLIASHFTLTGTAVGEPSRFTFAERVAAAATAGFTAIGIEAASYDAVRATGLSDGDLQAILADHGIAVGEIEFLFDWAHDGERGAAARRLEDALFCLADVFRPHHLNVGELGGGGAMGPIETVVERFAALCDRAAVHDLAVAIEFLPWTDVPDAGVAWEIARRAGRANGGVLVDAWHHFRGAADPVLLRAIPGDRIFAVQLDDADAVAVGEPFEDTILRRRYPGEGAFDLVGLVRLLDEIGVQAPLSVEILATEHRALPIERAARRAYESTRAVVHAARGR